MNIISRSLSLGDGKIRVVVKDSIDIQNEVTTLGTQARVEACPANSHAEIIKNILSSDCKIIGKTHLHELAFGITGVNKNFGTPLNVKYPQLIPGGSSSGSAAAIAADLADFSIGTDTGGSIRMPAACCGVYGLKPSFGRVSRDGVWPKDTTLDCVGPFASDINNLILAMQIIDPTFNEIQIDLQQIQLGILRVEAESEIWRVLDAELTKIDLPQKNLFIDNIDEAYQAGMSIINYETWGAYHDLTQTGLLANDVQQRLLKASETTQKDVENAELIRTQFTEQINDLLNNVDVLILPTLPQFPPKLDEAENTVAFLNLTKLVRPFNLSGHPALTIPYETSNGLPVGMQLIAKHGEDEKLCAIAQHIVDITKHSQGGGK